MVLESAPTDTVTIRVNSLGEGAPLTLSAGFLVFTAMDWDTPQAVAVNADEDANAVDDRATLTHTATGGDYEGAPIADVEVTVTETTLPVVSVADAQGEEGAGGLEFEVTLSPVSDRTVTVDWTVRDGTAVSGEDYAAAGGTLTFAAGETAATITVTVVDDELDEADRETFTVELSNPSQAVLSGGVAVLAATGTILDDDDAAPPQNAAPVFVEGERARREVAENTAAGSPIGAPVAATDDQELSYSLGGPDADSFAIDASSGQLRTRAPLDHEARPEHTVTVTASDGVASASIAVTVSVTDVAEPPPEPALVAAAGSGPGRVVVSWTAPEASGGPAIDRYEVRYRAIGDEEYTDVTGYDGVLTRVTLEGLEPGKRYEIQVRAVNEEGPGPWSTLTTDSPGPENRAPVAVDDSAATAVDTAVAIDVLANDDDADGDTLAVISVSDPAHGAARIDADGRITYTPDAGYDGGDGFSYRISDGTGADNGIAEGRVVVTVLAPNAAPEAVGRIPEQRLTAGADPVEVEVARYFHDPDGEALSYAARSSDPRVATVTVAAGRVRIAPMAAGGATITVTATDPGGLSAEQVIEVRVEPERVEGIGRAMGRILPEEVRTRVDSALSAVRGRIEARRSGAAAQPALRLGGFPGIEHALSQGVAWKDGRDLGRLARTSSFLLPLEASGAAGGPPADLTLWGGGDYRDVSVNDGSGASWRGSVLSAHVGADAHVSEQVLAGVLVSWSRGRFDNPDPGAAWGDYDSRLTSLNPYVSWTSPWGMSAWAAAGLGRGEVALDGSGLERWFSDLDQRSVAAGVSGVVFRSVSAERGADTTLKVRGEGLLARAEVAGAGAIPALAVDVSRWRLALEAAHARTLAAGGLLEPSFELGWRHDGGDGATGTGVEVGGGVRYRNPAAGLILEGRGRALLTNGGGDGEWGVGGALTLGPGAAGRGLSFSLRPAWGETDGGVARLWDHGASDAVADGQETEMRVEARLGYGIPAFGGLLTPYGGFARQARGGRRYVLGGSLQTGLPLDLNLEAELRRRHAEERHYGLTLQATLRF